jgi:hypothetical protein
MATLAGAIVCGAQAHSARAAGVSVTVPGTSMPWTYGAKLNKARPFGEDDGTAPTVVSLASLSAAPGQKLRITYGSGTVCPGGGYTCADGAGDPGFVTNHNTGNSGTYFPSRFVHKEPTYLEELIGVFTDASGKIVGSPFAVGDKLAKAIPAGATQLQLGVNDDIFGDNTGSWVISVTPLN